MATPKLLLLFILPLFCHSQLAFDKTLDIDESGLDVVDAVILKIRRLAIFPDDFNYLRRLAYVETTFGLTIKNDGGIWNLSPTVFDSTAAVPTEISDRIQSQFGLTWSLLTHVDCRKPLISGLAASIAVFLKLPDSSSNLRPIQNIMEQAQFLQTIGMTSSFQTYVSKVQALEGSLKCYSRLDLTFAIGGSAMRGATSFQFTTQNEVQFAKNMVPFFNFDTTRFGLVTLNRNNQVGTPIHLDNENTESQLSNLIGMTDYAGADPGTTFINSEIQSAVQMIKASTPRPGVPQILIIFSNRESSEGIDQIELAKEAGIKTYSVSVGMPDAGSVHAQQLLGLAQDLPRNVFPTYDPSADFAGYQKGLEWLHFRLIPQLCALHQSLGVDDGQGWDGQLFATEGRFFSVQVVQPPPPADEYTDYYISIGTDGDSKDVHSSLSYSELYPSTAMYDLEMGAGENKIPLAGAVSGSTIYFRVLNTGTQAVRLRVNVATTEFVPTTTTTTDETTSTTEDDSTTTTTTESTTQQQVDSTTNDPDSTTREPGEPIETTTNDGTTVNFTFGLAQALVLILCLVPIDG